MNRLTYQIMSTPALRLRRHLENRNPLKTLRAPALSAFPSGLRHFLCDPDARVDLDHTKQTPTSIFVVISTKLSEQQCDDVAKQCLDSFHLLGKKLSTDIVR